MLSCVVRPGFRASLGCAAVLALCAGCGSRGDLSGKVTYKGANLKGGYVTFVSADDGPTFSSEIAADGSYSVPNMSSGNYKVCVDTEMLKGNTDSGSMPRSRSGGGPPRPASAPLPGDKDKSTHAPAEAAKESGYTPGGPPAAMKKANLEKYVQIPDEYRDATSTKLEYNFPGGTQVHNLELK